MQKPILQYFVLFLALMACLSSSTGAQEESSKELEINSGIHFPSIQCKKSDTCHWGTLSLAAESIASSLATNLEVLAGDRVTIFVGMAKPSRVRIRLGNPRAYCNITPSGLVDRDCAEEKFHRVGQFGLSLQDLNSTQPENPEIVWLEPGMAGLSLTAEERSRLTFHVYDVEDAYWSAVYQIGVEVWTSKDE